MVTRPAPDAVLRLSLMVGALIGLACVGLTLIRYPASPGQTALYLVAGALLLLCGLAALVGTRPATADGAVALRLGGVFGLLIGGLWIVEVLTGNLIAIDSAPSHVIYRVSATGAFLLPLVAGGVGAARTGRVRMGLAVGFWSGVLSGLVTFLTLMAITYAFMDLLRHDPQNLRGYAHSGERTLATFIVGDSLFGASAHLALIGPAWGSALGGLGGALVAWRRRPSRPGRRRTRRGSPRSKRGRPPPFEHRHPHEDSW